jgi:ribosomal protein L21E
MSHSFKVGDQAQICPGTPKQRLTWSESGITKKPGDVITIAEVLPNVRTVIFEATKADGQKAMLPISWINLRPYDLVRSAPASSSKMLHPYKVGDQVQIRPDLDLPNGMNWLSYNIRKNPGDILTITDTKPNSHYVEFAATNNYGHEVTLSISIDHIQPYKLNQEDAYMSSSQEICVYKVGDKVQIRHDTSVGQRTWPTAGIRKLPGDIVTVADVDIDKRQVVFDAIKADGQETKLWIKFDRIQPYEPVKEVIVTSDPDLFFQFAKIAVAHGAASDQAHAFYESHKDDEDFSAKVFEFGYVLTRREGDLKSQAIPQSVSRKAVEIAMGNMVAQDATTIGSSSAARLSVLMRYLESLKPIESVIELILNEMDSSTAAHHHLEYIRSGKTKCKWLIKHYQRHLGIAPQAKIVATEAEVIKPKSPEKEQSVCETDANGTKEWYLNGQLHREDGPAVECANGKKYWYLNGQRHREDGPAVECANGHKSWHLNGQRHREDGPAVECANGTKEWYLNGQLHREDGPAIEYADGTKQWFLNGKEVDETDVIKLQKEKKNQPVCHTLANGTKEWRLNGNLHREDGPAREWSDGTTEWWLNDKLHREGGPASERKNGDKSWWLNGKRHREDGPAIEYADGSKYWYRNGEYHREDGPACEHADGNKEWWLNGQQHREDGPAVEWSNGTKEWFLNGQQHREDGPAVEYIGGTKEWWLNGKKVDEADVIKLQEEKKNQPVCHTLASGTKEWRLNGNLHREDGPAIEGRRGTKYWYRHGKRHRTDGPAVEYSNGTKEWWLNGRRQA